MKLTKLSLVAALLVGSSAFAFDNTKMSGDTKLFYNTDNSAIGLFNKDKATAQASLGLGVTTDVSDVVKGEVHLTALSSLGLENQLVSGVWEGTNGTDDSFWFDTAKLSTTVGKTNLEAGRMVLDTPIVFSETWSVAYNTFEAAVVANTDLPDTVVVAAYIGGANDNKTGGTGTAGGTGGIIGGVNANGNTNFHQFYTGAYVAGAVNNSWKPLTAQLWYYNVTSMLSAYWLQADVAIDSISLGAQYTGGTDVSGASDIDLSAYALKAAYEMKDTFSISAAYSQTGKDSGWGANLSGTTQSKLYTEAWWNYGAITAQDTSAINVTVGAPIAGLFDFGLYYTMATQTKAAAGTADDLTMKELTLEAAKSFGNLDTALIFINATNEIAAGTSGGDAVNTLQVYLTYNF